MNGDRTTITWVLLTLFTRVRRGTNHAWRNVTPDKLIDGKQVGQWARMLYVLESADPLEVEGKTMEEDEGGIV
jgi:hypothetical protein